MKKTLLRSIVTIIIIATLTVSLIASDTTNDLNGQVTVEFNENTIFTVSERETIEKYFISTDDEQYQPAGLWCTLFGHDYKTEITDVISHKVYSSAPRCIRNRYKVTICTRCSQTESELMSTARINCCS